MQQYIIPATFQCNAQFLIGITTLVTADVEIHNGVNVLEDMEMV